MLYIYLWEDIAEEREGRVTHDVVKELKGHDIGSHVVYLALLNKICFCFTTDHRELN